MLKSLEGVDAYSLEELARRVAQEPELESPVVVFLKAAGAVETLESVRSLRVEVPGAFIVLVEDLSPEVQLLLEEAGVWSVTSRASTLADFRRILDSLPLPEEAEGPPAVEEEEPEGAPPEEEVEEVREGHLLAVISPKGGVGKTSIATNLALALAQRHPKQVVLVDLDLQFGDVCTQLDVHPHRTVEHAVEAAQEKDLLVLKAILTLHPEGFYVVPGAVSPLARDTLGSGELSTMLKQLARAFPYVLVDTGGGLDESTLVVLEEATAALLVSTLDISSARGLKKELELLRQLSLLPPQQLFVVNKVERNLSLRPKDLEDAIGHKVAVAFDRDREVSVAVNRGVPLVLSRPKADFSKKMVELAKLVEGLEPAHFEGVA